ncbi:hypothetical protein [Legionella waltersii]|uniref:Protease of the Abi (CAAX) family protein n=1 Tax=Legionella waltersii TaxID=66969 RepID=A0A0W1A182_9GAMM|nr:hypothetical protein [Legionella waltersii]KTD75101.1 protease of the Abi (CAAX) family protein [Legionella waltersii]SNV05105.1 protease of the Abi (CAAX) family [Legionella waltersii]
MPLFFDKKNKILHKFKSEPLILPAAIVQHCVKVDENTMIQPKLRRAHAGNELKTFFSTDTNSLSYGLFDITDKTNTDLIEVTSTISYQ